MQTRIFVQRVGCTLQELPDEPSVPNDGAPSARGPNARSYSLHALQYLRRVQIKATPMGSDYTTQGKQRGAIKSRADEGFINRSREPWAIGWHRCLGPGNPAPLGAVCSEALAPRCPHILLVSFVALRGPFAFLQKTGTALRRPPTPQPPPPPPSPRKQGALRACALTLFSGFSA